MADTLTPALDDSLLNETRALLPSDSSLTEQLPRVYDELRRLAAYYLQAERAGHTLQPTALVHEAYLRLADQDKMTWANRAQFMAVAARMMRRILVNHALAKKAEKRGSAAPHLSLDEALGIFDRRAIPAIPLNEALQELEALDARQAQIVELRFFGGLTVPETADLLGISSATVKREWNVAKLWLQRQIKNAA